MSENYKDIIKKAIEESKEFVYDKPNSTLMKSYEKHSTYHLKDMHNRWVKDHRDRKTNPETSEKLLAVHHVLKNRGEEMNDLPTHPNLGMKMYNESVGVLGRDKFQGPQFYGAVPRSATAKMKVSGIRKKAKQRNLNRIKEETLNELSSNKKKIETEDGDNQEPSVGRQVARALIPGVGAYDAAREGRYLDMAGNLAGDALTLATLGAGAGVRAGLGAARLGAGATRTGRALRAAGTVAGVADTLAGGDKQSETRKDPVVMRSQEYIPSRDLERRNVKEENLDEVAPEIYRALYRDLNLAPDSTDASKRYKSSATVVKRVLSDSPRNVKKRESRAAQKAAALEAERLRNERGTSVVPATSKDVAVEPSKSMIVPSRPSALDTSRQEYMGNRGTGPSGKVIDADHVVPYRSGPVDTSRQEYMGNRGTGPSGRTFDAEPRQEYMGNRGTRPSGKVIDLVGLPKPGSKQDEDKKKKSSIDKISLKTSKSGQAPSGKENPWYVPGERIQGFSNPIVRESKENMGTEERKKIKYVERNPEAKKPTDEKSALGKESSVIKKIIDESKKEKKKSSIELESGGKTEVKINPDLEKAKAVEESMAQSIFTQAITPFRPLKKVPDVGEIVKKQLKKGKKMLNIREALQKVAENGKNLEEQSAITNEPVGSALRRWWNTPSKPSTPPTISSGGSGSIVGAVGKATPQQTVDTYTDRSGKTVDATTATPVTSTDIAARVQSNAADNTRMAMAEPSNRASVTDTINKQLETPETLAPVTSADVARATPKPVPTPRPVAPKPSGPTPGERTADELMARYNKPGGVEVSGGSVTPNPMGPGSVAPRGVTPPGGVEGKLETEDGPKGKRTKVSESALINAFLQLVEKQSPDMFAEAKKQKMAKKDWDGDGKVESEKDEVWGSRFKAAKKAGKMEEAKKWCESCKAESGKCSCKKMEESEQIDEISRGVLSRYLTKTNPEYNSPEENKKRETGRKLALQKKWGDDKYGFTEPKVKATEEVKELRDVESIFSEEEIAHFEAVMERGAQQNITTRKEKGDRVAETVPTRNLTD